MAYEMAFVPMVARGRKRDVVRLCVPGLVQVLVNSQHEANALIGACVRCLCVLCLGAWRMCPPLLFACPLGAWLCALVTQYGTARAARSCPRV
jgi:hypothetical protein